MEGVRRVKTKRLSQIKAGRLVTAVIYTQPAGSDGPHIRAAKQKASSEARQRLNLRASWQKLEALMAANFDREDLFVTLTYRDEDLPHSREQAVRCCCEFVRQLREARALRGEQLLYIKNVEHLRDDGTEGRWHHHLVINSTGSGDYEEIRAAWKRWGDDVDIQELLGEGWDYAIRAQYLCKERQPVGRQSWTPGRGLRRPERYSEMVDESLTLAPPPGATVIENQTVDNGWGSYVYLKYLLPWKPRRRAQRRYPKRRE